MRHCSKCDLEKPINSFYKQNKTCRSCRNAMQRERRKSSLNKSTRVYERTHKGFLMRAYSNMKARITGVQKQNYHLYSGKELLSREEFYRWAESSKEFKSLFEQWEKSHYNRKLTPSVDRVNSKLGYILSNMEWVTSSENSKRVHY